MPTKIERQMERDKKLGEILEAIKKMQEDIDKLKEKAKVK